MKFKAVLTYALCLSLLLSPPAGAAHAQVPSQLRSVTKSIIAFAGPVTSGDSELAYLLDRLEEEPISPDELSDIALDLFSKAFLEASRLN